MSQLSIFDLPPLEIARAMGEAGMQRAAEAAERIEPSFTERAAALILEKLKHGPASGEDCTDYVSAAGLKFADGRALGKAYARLAARGLIQQVGSCPRRKGHGGAGGRIWKLTTPGLVQRGARGRFAANGG